MRVRAEIILKKVLITPVLDILTERAEDYLVTIQALEPCEGAPEPEMTIASIDSVCAGGAIVNFTLEDDYTSFSEIEYQWLIKSGDGWMPIENETIFK